MIKIKNIWFIEDLHSTNGTYLNGNKITGRNKLHESDTIFLANTKMTFTGKKIKNISITNGVSLDIINISKRIKAHGKFKTLVNDITCSIMLRSSSVYRDC